MLLVQLFGDKITLIRVFYGGLLKQKRWTNSVNRLFKPYLHIYPPTVYPHNKKMIYINHVDIFVVGG